MNQEKNKTKLIINGKMFLAENNQTILQACEKIGLFIPRFCYNEALSIAGNRRMCLIEIEKSPKLMPACAIKIANDMKIYTKTNLVKKARESILEFLLINHPLDCRAPFNYYYRRGSIPTSKVSPRNSEMSNLCCKAIDSPIPSQWRRDQSMSIKVERSSYSIQGKDNELDYKLCERVKKPFILYTHKYMKWAIKEFVKWTVFIILGKPMDSDARSILAQQVPNYRNSGNNRNSGSSENGNDRRWRSLHSSSVPLKRNSYNKIAIRYYSSDKTKEGRDILFGVTKPAGIVELNEFILEKTKTKEENIANIEKAMRLISRDHVLMAAYDKVSRSAGVTYGQMPMMDSAWINKLSWELGSGAYQCSPSKRIYIPKPNGGQRPLGIPSFKDKIVQEAIKLLLEPIFENKFLEHSHGFRPNKGTRTALKEIKNTFTSVKWFIEMDIAKCFDSLEHELIIKKIRQVINDPLLEQTLRKLLRAGYLYRGEWVKSTKGVPQGSILGPLLSNIYLHELDVYLTKLQDEFNVGSSRRRRRNPEYTANMKKGNHINTPPFIEKDENFKKMLWTRYADDCLIGVIGSKEDCQQLKEKIAKFLETELSLNLNMEKTLITHSNTESAKFLGYYISITDNKTKPVKTVIRQGIKYKMRINTRPQLIAPIGLILKKLKIKGLARETEKGNKITGTCFNLYTTYDDATIVAYMRGLWTGIRNYYELASNYTRLHDIRYVIWTSCALTLAKKHKLKTVSKTIKKYGKDLKVNPSITFPYKESLTKQKTKDYKWTKTADGLNWMDSYLNRWQRTNKLLGKVCAICESTEGIAIHHVNKLKNTKGKDIWHKLHSAHQRKQIPVCRNCHGRIHKGQYDGSNLGKIQTHRETERNQE